MGPDRPVRSAGGHGRACLWNLTAPGTQTASTPLPVQFEVFVRAGGVHYYIASGGGMAGGAAGNSTRGDIASWVQKHFRAEPVGGRTVYDLTQPAS
jgi:hypothetical protein